jgi:putative membrane protein
VGHERTGTVNEHPFLDTLLWVFWRLYGWLAAIALYFLAVAFVVYWLDVPRVELGLQGAAAQGFILGLLLAFRNRAAYDRWWEGRRLWGQLINEMRNLAWKIRGYLPAEVVAAARLPAVLVGFDEALKRHLRGGCRLQEVPGFEHETDTPAHVPSYLAGRLLTSLADWHRRGVIDGSAALILDVHARALLDVCGGCERIRNTAISASYKALIRGGIAANLLVAPWLSLPDLGLWGVPILLLIFAPMLGVELVDTVVEEPFGTDLDDLDLDRYCRAIEQSVAAILNGKGVAS